MRYVRILLAAILFNYGNSFSDIFNQRRETKEVFIARYEKTAIEVTSEKENSEKLPSLLKKIMTRTQRSGRFNVSYLFEFWGIFQSC